MEWEGGYDVIRNNHHKTITHVRFKFIYLSGCELSAFVVYVRFKFI